MILDILSWAGVLLALLNTFLISTLRMHPAGRVYLCLSWLANCLMVPASVWRGNYQAAALSFTFSLIVTHGYITHRPSKENNGSPR